MSSDLSVNDARPADLIAAVWYTLGFRPLNSLVLVGLHGPRGRVGSMLRVDLAPAWFGPAGLASVFDAAIAGLTGPAAPAFGARPGSGEQARGEPVPMRVVALVASHDALAVPSPPVIRALPGRMQRAGLWLFDVIAVTPTAFRSLACPDATCCPPGGRPLAEVESSRVALAHVLRGDRLAETEADVIGDVGVPVPAHERDGESGSAQGGTGPATCGGTHEGACGDSHRGTCRGTHGETCEGTHGETCEGTHGETCGETCEGTCGEAGKETCAETLEGSFGSTCEQGDPGADYSERERRRWWRTWNALLGRAEGWSSDQLDPAALNDPHLRDAVFVRLVAAPGPTRVRFLAQLMGGHTPPDLAEHWETLFSGRPDRERIARGEEILAALARRGTAAERGPVLAVLALLAWYRGSGVRTRLLVERLHEENPGLLDPPDEAFDEGSPGRRSGGSHRGSHSGSHGGSHGGSRSGSDREPASGLPRLAGLVEMLCTAGIAPPWVEEPEEEPGDEWG